MQLPVLFLALVVALSSAQAADCRPSDVLGALPKYASDESLVQHAHIVARGVAKDSPEPGTLRISVQSWEKGTGPAEILVGGFPHGHTMTSCDALHDEIEFDVPHLFVLEDPPKDGQAQLFHFRSIPTGKVFRRAIPRDGN
jgi:hypothetical protein